MLIPVKVVSLSLLLLLDLHIYILSVCDYCYRFSIDRTTDQEMIFHIDPDSGAITLRKVLDRETAGWHNITVRAVETGTLLPFSDSAYRLCIFVYCYDKWDFVIC